MKVILTAFQGKLKSDPMDWPDKQPPTINMMMNMPTMKLVFGKFGDHQLAEDLPRFKRGVFEATGKHFVLNSRETAEEYVLTDIS